MSRELAKDARLYENENKILGFVLHSAAAAMPLFSLALVIFSFSGKAARFLRQGKALAFAQGVFVQSVLSSCDPSESAIIADLQPGK